MGEHMTTAEENKELVREAFRPWESGDSGPLFDLIADDVHWTVIGTTSASGVFGSKQALVDAAYGPLLGRLDGPLITTFQELAADGDRVLLRFESEGRTKRDGHHQVYCWAMTMRDRRIVEIVAYLDTELLMRVSAS
jgi:uncharacterized protein